MPTTAELQTKEEELKALASQNQDIVNESIPERKYGNRITAETQQQYVNRRNIALQNLSIINQQQTELSKSLESQRNYDAQVKAYNEDQQARSAAMKYYERGIPYYFIKGSKSYKYLKELYDNYGAYKEPAVKPADGGYYVDPKTGEGISSKYNLEDKGYVKIADRAEISSGNLIKRPEAPNLVIGGETSKSITFVKEQSTIQAGGYNRAPEVFNLQSRNPNAILEQKRDLNFIQRAQAEVIKDIGIPVAKAYQNPISEGLLRPVIVAADILKKTDEFYKPITRPVLRPIVSTLNQDIDKMDKLNPQLFEADRRAAAKARSFIKSALKDIEERPITNLVIMKGAGLIGEAFVTPTIEFFTAVKRVIPLAKKGLPRAKGLDFVKLSENEFKFTEKITVPARYQTVNTGIGEFLRDKPMARKLLVNIAPTERISNLFKAERTRTLYSPQIKFVLKTPVPIKISEVGIIAEGSLTTLQKVSPLKPGKTVSILSGISKKEEFAQFKAFDAGQQKQVDSLFKSLNRKSGNLNVLKENEDLFTGYLESKDLFNLRTVKGKTYQDILLTPKRRSLVNVQRAEVVGIQSKVYSDTEKEIFDYAFSTRDVTYPTSRPRGYPKTRGQSYVQLEKVDSSFNAIGEKTIQKGSKVNLDTIKNQITSLNMQKIAAKTVKPISLPKLESITTKPLMAPIKSVSMLNKPRTANIPKSSLKTNSLELSRILSKASVIQRPMTLTRTSLRTETTARETTRQIPRLDEALKPALREETRLRLNQREMLRQVPRLKLETRLTPRPGSPMPKIKLTPRPRPGPTRVFIPKFNINLGSNTKSRTSTGFATFIKRFGKVITLPGIRSKGEALVYGEKKARNTLAATFGIRPTQVKVSSGRLARAPSSKFFRAFKISKGQKINLDNMFIQKSSNRLSSYGEKREIQLSRRLAA